MNGERCANKTLEQNHAKSQGKEGVVMNVWVDPGTIMNHECWIGLQFSEIHQWPGHVLVVTSPTDCDVGGAGCHRFLYKQVARQW